MPVVPLLVAALLLFVRLQVPVLLPALLFVAALPALLAVLPELLVVLPAPL